MFLLIHFRSGDRFIEEKTLLLAVRSFVFFSQLSAWLSVSHGAVPRNILYRYVWDGKKTSFAVRRSLQLVLKPFFPPVSLLDFRKCHVVGPVLWWLYRICILCKVQQLLVSLVLFLRHLCCEVDN